jgi:hypothetical protein
MPALVYASFADCALTEFAIEDLITACDNNGLNDGYIDVSGGTNAVPNGATLVLIGNLTGKGWTVNYNP